MLKIPNGFVAQARPSDFFSGWEPNDFTWTFQNKWLGKESLLKYSLGASGFWTSAHVGGCEELNQLRYTPRGFKTSLVIFMILS